MPKPCRTASLLSATELMDFWLKISTSWLGVEEFILTVPPTITVRSPSGSSLCKPAGTEHYSGSDQAVIATSALVNTESISHGAHLRWVPPWVPDLAIRDVPVSIVPGAALLLLVQSNALQAIDVTH